MKPIYKSVILESAVLTVSLSLQANVSDGSDVTTTGIDASTLDGLRVELVAPNVSGARDLIKSGECTLDGSELAIVLAANDWLKGGVYRLQVSATFGTQTMVIYSLDVTVPRYDALGDETQEYEDTVTVVSTIGGGGGGGGADATVYALDGNGNANITKPLTVRGSVREGNNTTASGNCSHAEGSDTIASGGSSHAEGSSTTASGNCSHAEGSDTAADGHYSHAEGLATTASGDYSHAEGSDAVASGPYSHAEGFNTVASGDYSHAEGNNTIASQESQHVCGQYNVEDNDDSFQFIVGNGLDDDNRSNAFAVTKSGELVLFEADGTPVILDAATLKALIASLT